MGIAVAKVGVRKMQIESEHLSTNKETPYVPGTGYAEWLADNKGYEFLDCGDAEPRLVRRKPTMDFADEKAKQIARKLCFSTYGDFEAIIAPALREAFNGGVMTSASKADDCGDHYMAEDIRKLRLNVERAEEKRMPEWDNLNLRKDSQ